MSTVIMQVIERVTNFWYTPKDVALCQDCAEIIESEDIPSKAEWLDEERELTPKRFGVNKMTIIRGFHHFNEAYYAKDVPLPVGVYDEIMIGLYDTDGGTTGEFAIRWVNVSGRSVQQLKAFSDSWKALGEFKDLLTAMENAEEYVTPEKFCKLLVSLGVVDLTDKGN